MRKLIVGTVVAAVAVVGLMAFTPTGGGAPAKKDMQQQIDDLKAQVDNLNLRVTKLESAMEPKKSVGFTPQ